MPSRSRALPSLTIALIATLALVAGPLVSLAGADGGADDDAAPGAEDAAHEPGPDHDAQVEGVAVSRPAPAPGALPVTGSSPAPLALLGGLTMALGAALLLAGRRHARAT